MTDWIHDFHYGVRMLIKRPGTSAIAVVALALGIGLTTVMFSIVQGVILRGLPYEGGDRVMLVSRSELSEAPGNRRPVSVHDFVDWRERQRSFESLAAFSNTSVVVTGDGAFAERYSVSRMTPNTLSVLGVRPALGRDLAEADAEPGSAAVALISHAMWRSRFQADPSALGRTVRFGDTPTTVVGVMPHGFAFPQTADAWVPLELELPDTRGQGASLRVIGRLRDGVSEAQARAEMAGIAAQLREAYDENADLTAILGPYVHMSLGNEVVSTLFTMLGAVFGVMLIACVNVTNLQLARAAERTKEVAIRTALGSGRWRIVRQLLAEGLLLSAAGALLGLGLAQAGTVAFMRAIVDTDPPFWIDVRVDPVVLLFVVAITVTAALVSSLAPGWRVARADANAVLKDETRAATGLRMGAFSRWLVVVEVTASCVLLVVSGLMIRQIVNTSRFDYPFATDNVFTAQVSLVGDLEAPERAVQLEQLEQRLARIPGVRAVALSTAQPGDSGDFRFSIDGVADPVDEDARPTAGYIRITPAYFDVLRVSLQEGRGVTIDDRQGALPVTVIDEALARRYLGSGSPLGRRLRFGDADQPWRTIVGIVPSLAEASETGQMIPTAYVPYAQAPSSFARILAWTSGEPTALTTAVRTAVQEVDAGSPVSRPGSLADELWLEGWPFRVFGGLFLLFGIAALVMAAAGLYGVMAFSVRRRTQEIGVRMALGAPRRRVLGMILWQGFWRVALGVVVGIVPGWYVGTLMGALLEDASPADPVVHGTTIATLLVTGLLACLAPALRAASVDPLTALRRD